MNWHATPPLLYPLILMENKNVREAVLVCCKGTKKKGKEYHHLSGCLLHLTLGWTGFVPCFSSLFF